MQSGYKMTNNSSENKGALYVPRDAEIISVSDLTPDEKLFSLRMKDGSDLNHLPGQFVQLSILGFTEAPISVASSPTRKGLFDLAIRRAGTSDCRDAQKSRRRHRRHQGAIRQQF